MIDLRLDDVYEVNREEWNKRNILYNTIWFAVKKKSGPDMEFCETAVENYKNNKFYSKWGEDEHYGGKVLIPDKTKTPITADLMTGWWNPLKFFMRLSQDKEREVLLEGLLVKMDKDPSARDPEGAEKWLEENAERSNKACKSCISFLEVVYTPGNIIPAACNPGTGRYGLDGWDTKLKTIRDVYLTGETTVTTIRSTKAWGHYIHSIFGGSWEEFVEINDLQNFFSDKEYRIVKSFWGEKGITKPTLEIEDDDWENYFKNAHDRIEERNRIIAKRNKEVERDERDN